LTTAPSVVRSPRSDEPLRYECKLCSFKCRYDFSYIAHLNQHDKLRELHIDDLQSHLVAAASSAQMPPSSAADVLNRFAIRVIDDHRDGGVPRVDGGHSQVVDGSGISYILLCPGPVDEPAVVTALPHQQGSVVAQPPVDCLGSNVVLVDDVVEHGLASRRTPSADDDVVDFDDGPEMRFLNSAGGEEAMYAVNDGSLQVALTTDADRQRTVVYEEAETEVVLSPQSQLLDVASLCSDEDASVAGEDSFTCYYCNAVFSSKSPLQRHILQLHVD